MTTPHKHAELIKAWADGAEIEYQNPDSGAWYLCAPPAWKTEVVYRIKPEKKWYRVAELNNGPAEWTECADNEAEESRMQGSASFKRWLSGRIYYE